MVHPALALYDSSFRKRVFASLVHFSMDVRLAREGETVVSLGLLFENSTGRALQDAEFILRLPEGATVNFMECEVERADRNIVLSASTESLCGKYGMNTSQEGPFFLCHIGRISANRDVVVFLNYNYKPLWTGFRVQLSFPLPGKLCGGFSSHHKFSINLEAEEPYMVTNVTSGTHQIKSTPMETKTRVAILNQTLHGDLDLTVTTDKKAGSQRIPAFRSPRMLSDTNIWDVDDNNKDDHCHPSMSILEEYIEGAVAAPFSEKCKSSSCGSSTTYHSSQSFFLDDSDSESAFEIEEESEERKRGQPIMGDLSSPQSILSFDGFETRATWFPGVHLPTSWLDDMELDSQEEFVDTSTDELTSGYSVIKVETATAIVTDRPRIVDIPPSGLPRSHPTRSSFKHFEEEVLSRLHKLEIATSGEEPESCGTEALTYNLPSVSYTPNKGSLWRGVTEVRFSNKSASTNPSVKGPKDLMNSLSNALRWAPGLFFELNDEFAALVGVPLDTLKNHQGAQAHILPHIWYWVRTGIWANAVAFQFLHCYCKPLMYSKIDEVARETLEQEFNSLCYRIRSPVTDHDWYKDVKGEGMTFSELCILAHNLLLENAS